MSLRIPRLSLILACLAVALLAPSLHGQDEPFTGLWDRPFGEGPDGGLFLHSIVQRYHARATLRSAGLLPERYRAKEDSLGLRSDRLEDFIILQDSLGMGWLPPRWARLRGREPASSQVTYLGESRQVEESRLIRGTPVGPSVTMELDRYLDRITRKSFRALWKTEADRNVQLEGERGAGKGLVPELALPIEMPGAIRSIVGAGRPNLTVRGSERISFSGTSRWYPDRPVTEFQRKQSKFPQLDMKQELNLQLTGNIGDKVSVDVDQSSQAATPLANRIKIHYKGYQDEIVQRVDLGNTSLQLPGTQYVSYGGRHEGLFGINAQALVGDVELTGIVSKQEGKNVQGNYTKNAAVAPIKINDWQYVQGKFFFLVDPDGPPLTDLVPGSVEVWIDDRNGANNLEQGTTPAYVTLTGSLDTVREEIRGTGEFFHLTQNDDYIVLNDIYTGYPVLVLSDGQTLDGAMSKALAVRYLREEGPDVGGALGTSPDSLVLKLLRPSNDMGGTNPFDLTQGDFAPTRSLELRNVYDLGNNLSADGLNVRIRRTKTVGDVTNPDRIGDHTFLEILGLDLFTDAGDTRAPGTDGRIDAGRINYDSGYLMFCELQPFAPGPRDPARRCFVEGGPPPLSGDLTVPQIYTRNDWSAGREDPTTFSQYVIEGEVRAAVSRISLNAFNILQGSEAVTAGGRTLVRDRDYTIDYDTGEITIHEAADLRDTDDIQVSYSYLPFGGGAQKTLMGTALRYKPQDSNLGLSTTWVYESKGSPGVEGRRPRLGQEPTRTVVGELATSYKVDSWWLTSLVNDLPGVSTRQASSINFDGGVGLSFPNPNTRDRLYIDDFEGAKDETSVSLNRLGWKPSSIPRDAVGNSDSDRLSRRGEVWWYTPRAAVKEGDLQPTLESAGGLAETEKDDNRQVLELRVFPRGGTESERRESWVSLVQPISQRGLDLTRAQFLDIWINDFYPFDPPSERAKRQGVLHIDLGSVSENAIWQRIRPEELQATAFADSLLDPKLDTEDVNQDGQLDAPGGGSGEDVGVDARPDGEEVGTPPDPASDNWAFTEETDENDRDPGADRERFREINGTQGNGRLDTEDLNGNLILDLSESYFHFRIPLDADSLVEFESSLAPDQDPEYAPYTRGWRRVRVPLTPQYYDSIGIPRWEQIRHLRLWVEGLAEESRIQIGGIDITGNRWLKGTVRDSSGQEIPDHVLTVRGEDFFPAVLNNKDNSTSEYSPPFQPRERQNIEEREQSLTLETRAFQPEDWGTIYRTYAQGQDFASLYEALEFYLNSRVREGPDPELEFFIRLARNAASEDDNYYEYRTPVPDDWVLHRVDLVQLSQLQLLTPDSTGTTMLALDDGSEIYRKGNPSLTEIRRIAFGVENVGSTAVVSASVWIDELRLTSVKRDPGVAGRVAFGANFADLGRVNVNYSKQDADFLKIGNDRGSGRTQRNLSLATHLELQKFIERSGLVLPIDYTYSSNRDVPKFRTDGDLVLDRATDRDISEGRSQDLSFRVQRNRSANPWIRYTVDGITLSGRVGQQISNNPDSRDTTSTKGGQVQYSLPIQGGPPVRVYKNTELRLLPTNLTLMINGQEQKSTQYVRRNGDKNEPYILQRKLTTRTGTMNWSTGLRPIEPVSYTFDQGRDLRLSTAPKRFLGIRIGTETSRRHGLTASHQFGLFKKAIVPKISWSGNFDGRFNLIQTGSGVAQRGNSYNNANNLTVSSSLPLQSLLRKMGSILPGGGGGEGSKPPGEPAPEDSGVVRPTRERAPARGGAARGGGLISFSAIGATYTVGRTSTLNRISGEPSIAYQLGLSRDPGAEVRDLTGAARGTGDRRDLSLNTDIKLLTELSLRTTYQNSWSETATNGGVTEIRSVRFPDVDVNWGRFYKKLGLDRLAKELRASSRYSREKRTTGTNVNPKDREEVSVSLRPLLNLDATLQNGMSAKLTSSYASTRSEQFGVTRNASRSQNRQLGLTVRRSVNLSRTITHPITKKTSRVTSKLDLSLAVDMQDSKRESGPVGKLVTLEDRMKLAISTTGGYNFTSSITGNAGLTVGQDTDRKNKTNTARYVSVTISAAFNF